MKRKEILDALSNIDYDMVEDAEQPHRRKRNTAWIRRSVLAACLCLVLAALIALPIALRHSEDRFLEIPEHTLAPSGSSTQTDGDLNTDTLDSISDTESKTFSDTESESASESESDSAADVGGNSSLGNVDNGVLQSASTAEMKVPLNMKDLGTDNVKEENNTSAISATVGQDREIPYSRLPDTNGRS